MAYDRYDTRDERPRWRDDRGPDRDWRGQSDRERGWRGDQDRGGRDDDRGFFERAGDEIASWFGDEDAERRRNRDQMRDQQAESGSRSSRGGEHDRSRDYDRGYGRDYDRDRSTGPGRYANWNDNRGAFARGGSSERDYNRGWRGALWGNDDREQRGQERFRDGGRDYRPMTGDYGRSESSSRDDDGQSHWARDPYRDTSRAGTRDNSDRSRHEDPHYSSWRQRHLDELDRDYDDYRREHQSKFESDFGNWRERRQQKRGLLSGIREHMDVVGSDDEHVGKVDRVAGDRLILTKSDPESGGAHHSISCSDIDRVEGDRVILDCPAAKARERWRDESRGRALFEREDRGSMGPRMLDRSFGGTYR